MRSRFVLLVGTRVTISISLVVTIVTTSIMLVVTTLISGVGSY